PESLPEPLRQFMSGEIEFCLEVAAEMVGFAQELEDFFRNLPEHLIDEEEPIDEDYIPLGFEDLSPDFQTPENKAQYMMYEAWEEEDMFRGEMLALQALRIDPDCADAYNYLALLSESPQESAELYEKGIETGKKAIVNSEWDLEEAKGHYWGILETRPYMRAKAGLAQCLWEMGDSEQAIAHLQEMLELNPGDNQGVRYLLMGWLLEEGCYKAAHDLFEKYKNEYSAYWKYTAALLSFLDYGDCDASRRALSDAFEMNEYVPKYLLDRRKIPRDRLPHYSPGEDSEAVMYAQENDLNWVNIKNARKWLKKQWLHYRTGIE
ncbi:MAG: tetratricopeptide repeat protein, partial [Candidatus Sumerlaeota bacterium]